MRSLWRRLRSALPDRLPQRVTRAGLAFTLAVLLTGAAAFLSGNNLIFLITSALIAMLLVSGLVNRLSLSGLEVEFHPPQHLFAGEQAMAKLVVRNEKSWLPSFATRLRSIHSDGLAHPLYFPMLGGGQTLTEFAAVKFARRGRFRDNSLEFTSRFPFGFAERRARVTLHADVVVYPALEPHPAAEGILNMVHGELHARQAGPGDDFYRLRPYSVFDSARSIDWRSSARHQELHVREYAREESLSAHILVDLFTGTAGMEWLEAAFRCAAWLSSELDALDLRYSLRTQQRIVRVPDDGDLYTVLRYLALAEPTPFGSDDSLALLSPSEEDDSVLIVLTTDPARAPHPLSRRVHILTPGNLLPRK